ERTTPTTAPPRRSPPAAGLERGGGDGGSGHGLRDGTPRAPGAAAAARLLPRRTPEERDHGAVRGAAPAPADLHARLQGAVVLRARAARTHAAAPGRHAGDARRVRGAVRGGGARPACRRGERGVPVEPRRRSRDRRGAARREGDRGAARAGQLPALAAPAVPADLRRDRAGPAPRAGTGVRAPRGPLDPPPHLLARGAPVLRARPLHRAARALLRGPLARAGAGARL